MPKCILIISISLKFNESETLIVGIEKCIIIHINSSFRHKIFQYFILSTYLKYHNFSNNMHLIKC